MKKKFVAIFLFLFLLPQAYATLSIDGPDKSSYNIGDDVLISGYVFRENALTGQLKFVLNCDNTTFQLPSTSISLRNNEKKIFPDEFSIPKITISSSMIGNCFIEASLVSNNNVLETANSNGFEITKSLVGEFNIDKTDIQIGKSFTLTANIFKLNGQNVAGSAEIYFKTNDTSFLVDIANVNNGILTYTYNAIAIPADRYNIDVLVNDVFGNQELFENVATFNLINEITVFVKTDKETLLPGNDVKVYGNAQTVLQEEVKKGTVTIEVNNEEYDVELKDSKYEKIITLPTNIKSGKHQILVTIIDEFGNIGIADAFIFVNPIPTRLENKIDKNSYKPDEVIEIRPMLYDQANDLVSEDISIEIIDSKNEKIFTNVVKANNKVGFKLPKFASPGLYKITSYAVDLTREQSINIYAITDAEVSLDNQTIITKNIGNVVYKKPIKVDIDNGKYILVRRLSLDPGGTFKINLFEEIASGVYDIIVTLGDNTFTFNNVYVVGKEKKSFTFLYTIIAILLLILLAYLIFTKIRNFPRKERRKKRENEEIKRYRKDIEKIKIEKSGKPYRHMFGRASESDIKDFSNRVVKEIKNTEEGFFKSKKASLYSGEENKDMFKMFD